MEIKNKNLKPSIEAERRKETLFMRNQLGKAGNMICTISMVEKGC